MTQIRIYVKDIIINWDIRPVANIYTILYQLPDNALNITNHREEVN